MQMINLAVFYIILSRFKLILRKLIKLRYVVESSRAFCMHLMFFFQQLVWMYNVICLAAIHVKCLSIVFKTIYCIKVTE